MKKRTENIPILDLPGLAPFQRLHRNPCDLVSQGTRVLALFEADKTFYDLSERFNNNECVPILDLLHAQREIRAITTTLKSHTENEKEVPHEHQRNL